MQKLDRIRMQIGARNYRQSEDPADKLMSNPFFNRTMDFPKNRSTQIAAPSVSTHEITNDSLYRTSESRNMKVSHPALG